MNFKQIILVIGAISIIGTTAFAQTPLGVGKYNRQMEALQRGIIARNAEEHGIFISWRNLASENVTYNIYKNGEKLNKEPLAITNYTDEDGTDKDVYFVTVISENGTEGERSEGVMPFTDFLSIPVQKPDAQPNALGVLSDYTAQKGGVGDFDGDGEYEIMVAWYPNNSQDNSNQGHTSVVYLDAYKLDGTKLWRIDLGQNIRAGEHYVPVIIYDFDGDGKAELACRTSDGTIDGTGAVIGDKDAFWADNRGYILTGPEYLTIFEGLTGKAIHTVSFSPERGNVADWGDTGGNRVDRFLGGVAYLNGKTPSLIMSRGYYTNREGTVGKTEITAYNFRNGKIEPIWEFKANLQENINPDYVGQGNHSMVTADVDNDGFDEIIYGSMVVDHDGTGLYSTKRGHGDAIHVGFFKNEPRLQIVKANEAVDTVTSGYGFEYRYADKDEMIFLTAGVKDNGRTVVADIDPTADGPFINGAGGTGMWINRQGNQWERLDAGSAANAFPIWWTGDLLRELGEGIYQISGNQSIYPGYKVEKYNWESNKFDMLFNIDGVISGRRPLFQGDILGDWREELLLAEEDGSRIRLYTTNIPTEYNLTTLMHDPKYRLDIATQPSGYSQPPWTGYYIGHHNFVNPEKGTFIYNNIPAPIIDDSDIIGGNPTAILLKIGENNAVVNGEKIQIDENNSVVPFIQNDRTMVPIRFISETLGYTVEYHNETQIITLEKDDKFVTMQLGSDKYTVNGKQYQFDTVISALHGRTFVPLRVVSEIIEMNVEWNDEFISIYDISNSSIQEYKKILN